MSQQNKKKFNIQKLVSLALLLTFFAVGCKKGSDAETDNSVSAEKTDRSENSVPAAIADRNAEPLDLSGQKLTIQSIAGKRFSPSVAIGFSGYYFCGDKDAKSGTFVEDRDSFDRQFRTGTWKIVGDRAVVQYTTQTLEKGVGNFRASTHGNSYSKYAAYTEKTDGKAEFTENIFTYMSAYDLKGGCPTHSPVKEISKRITQTKFDINDAAGKLYLQKSEGNDSNPFYHNELYLCGEKGASSGTAVYDVQIDFEKPREFKSGTWKLNGNRIEVNYSDLQSVKMLEASMQNAVPAKKKVSEKAEFTEEKLRSAIVFEYKEKCPVLHIPKQD